MGGGVPLENLTGETEDISDYLDFRFYDQAWFHENAGVGERGIIHCIGFLRRNHGDMSYWVFKANGYVVSQTTVQGIKNLESEISEN